MGREVTAQHLIMHMHFPQPIFTPHLHLGCILLVLRYCCMYHSPQPSAVLRELFIAAMVTMVVMVAKVMRASVAFNAMAVTFSFESTIVVNGCVAIVAAITMAATIATMIDFVAVFLIIVTTASYTTAKPAHWA